MKSRSLTSILSDDDNETNNNRSMSDRKWQLNGRLNNCRSIVDGSLKLLNHGQPVNSFTIDEDWLPAAPSIPTTTNSIMHYANRQAKNHRHNKTNNYILWILTPVAASLAVAIIMTALAGPQWLLTEEKVFDLHNKSTSTTEKSSTGDGNYVIKTTKSSLWIICCTMGNSTRSQCSKIDYFPTEDYEPDPNDSSNSIPYAITHSTPFFLVSNVILLMSYTLLLTALCSRNHEIYYFISGVLFIIAGLLMLIGLIMYISIFKAEVGSKLRPKSSLQAPIFTFEYGRSFKSYVLGFIMTEFSGILSVLLYTNLQSSNTQTGLLQSKDRRCKQNSDMNRLVASSFTSQTVIFSPPGERRYFFKKDPDCHVHSQKFTKSLNQLYTDPAPDLPLNYRIAAPITRSVSTTTEINDQSPPTNSKTKSTSTSLRDLTNDMCGIRKNSSTLMRSPVLEEKLFQEFCKKMGPRPKPKTIYYIDGDDGGFENDGEDIFVIDTSNKQQRAKSIDEVDNENIARVRQKQQQQLLQRQPFSLPTNRSLCDLDKIYPDNYLNFKNNNASTGTTDGWRENRNCNTLPKNFLKNNKLQLGSGVKSQLDSKFSNVSPQPHHQWPKCIPTASMAQQQQQQHHRVLQQQHFSQYYSDYALDNNGSAKTLFHIEFDLDEIEREKRKSHASLFEESRRQESLFCQHTTRRLVYDAEDTGTPV